jgi:hypothetical protein
VLPSAQAWWSARPQVEASLAGRCAAVRQPEARLPEARARNARAETCRQAACPPVASLSAKPSAEPSASDVQVQPVAAAVAEVARESARRPVAAWVPSALRVGEAAEVAEPLAPQPAGAAAEHAAAEAVVPRAAAAALHGEVAAALHGAVAVEAGVPPASEAAEEEPQAVREPRAAGRPSAAAPSSPSRLRRVPGRPPAARWRRLARARPRLPIALPSARSWQAARVEVWS